MFARLMVPVLVVATVSFAVPRQVYAVSWGTHSPASDEQRELIDQLDRRLRSCEDAPPRPLVLKPSLEVFPKALRLKVVVMRSSDRAVLGSITTRAAGASRNAQLRAVASQVCREASQL